MGLSTINVVETFKTMEKIEERDSTGRFLAAGDEPIIHRVSFKLPASLKAELETSAGSRLSAWLREAVAEKLAKEAQSLGGGRSVPKPLKEKAC